MSLTPAQLELRRSGVSASEVAACLGMHPHLSLSKLYKLKCEGYEQPSNPFTDRGHRMERRLLEYWAKAMGATLEAPGTLRHPTRPLLLATPDGIGTLPNGQRVVVEAKTCTSKSFASKFGPDGTDCIPAHYILQTQAQMGVTGLTVAYVPVVSVLDGWEDESFTPERIRIYRVPFDADVFDALATAAESFWTRYVVPRMTPPGYRPSRAKKAEAA